MTCLKILLLIFVLIPGSIDLTLAFRIKSATDATQYLQQYGYMTEGMSNEFSSSEVDPSLSSSISTFQKFTGLNTSGRLDKETMNVMNMPRCGMAERMDIMENKNMNWSIVSHKVPAIRKWDTSRIYYKVHNFPGSSIIPDVVRMEIRRAFKLWEDVADLECIELANDEIRHKVHIDISFLNGVHGDGSPFGNEAAGNVVAHAFFPKGLFEGDVHFDMNRLWTSNEARGINLFQTAAHEIGHALGLDHSMFPESVMHMIVHSEIKDNFHLHEDDIQGIQNLYGRKRSWKSKRPPLSPIESNLFSISILPRPLVVNFVEEPRRPESTYKFEAVQDTSNDRIPIARPLSGLWSCFTLSKDVQKSKQTSDCYVQNVLRLLYFIKM